MYEKSTEKVFWQYEKQLTVRKSYIIIQIKNIRISYTRKEVKYMKRTKYLLGRDDVMEILECSPNHAYQVIRRLNEELQGMGYEVESGKVPRAFFETKYYGFADMSKD